MVQLPPIPTWDGLHPLIVHFPIALLLVAPIFVIVGGVLGPSRGQAFLVSALILMVVGTGSLFVTVATGEAARELVGGTPAIRAVVAQHEGLAETTELLFSVLSVVFAALLFAPRLLRRELTARLQAVLLAAFLVFYATGVLFLANTAHQGGRLVHELGVRAPVVATALTTTAREKNQDLPEGRGPKQVD